MIMVVGVVITLVVAGLVGWMIYASSGPPDAERYCLKCGKTTSWHPDKGCRECRLYDQFW